jgi:hypothetical protein
LKGGSWLLRHHLGFEFADPRFCFAARETVVRQESLRKFDALNELLATKDQMIWKLLKERQAAATDLDTLAKTSSGELQEWKR